MKKMSKDEIKKRIFDNPNPIFDEEIEFDDLIQLNGVKNHKVRFNKRTLFAKGANFQGVDLVFDGAVFHESLTIGIGSEIVFKNCSFYNIEVIRSHDITLSFQNCVIKNSIYFGGSNITSNILFENTIINEFKSVESDFSKLQFISTTKEIITIKKLTIVGKTVNILEFNKLS